MDTRVLLISDTVYDANGVSRFIQDMAAQARVTAAPFSVLSASPLAESTPESNIRNFRPYWSIRMPFYKEQYLPIVIPWVRIWRHIRTVDPDAIHISTPGPLGLFALFCAIRMGIPVAGTYHTDFPAYMRKQIDTLFAEKMTRIFMRFFYRRMQRVLSRSQRYMELLENQLQMEHTQLQFLAPGTDTQKFNPAHRDPGIWKRLDVRDDSFKILYVGRLSVEKNFLFVVELFEELQHASLLPISLIVVGEGALAEAVSRKRNSHIHLLGLQQGEALSKLYASSDLMLFASVTETLGQVVMEAQASGVPCIVSDRGGVTDIVVSDETGYCIAIENRQEWLESAMRLIGDDALRNKMGARAFIQMQSRAISTTFEAFLKVHSTL